MRLNKTCSCGVELTTRNSKKMDKANIWNAQKVLWISCKSCGSSFPMKMSVVQRTKDRFTALNNLGFHAWYSRTIKKLKKDGLDFCQEFIKENGELDSDEWMFKVNRLWLGQPAPKYADVAQEILCVVGTMTDPRPMRRRP